MDNEYITPEVLVGEDMNPEFASSATKETVSAVSQNTADTLTLAELNQALGKNYKDKESAINFCC
jgi:hypothetical protein